MKYFTLFLLVIAFTILNWSPSKAQNTEEANTIFDSDMVYGFGQFDVKYTLIKDEPTLLLGGQGGVILNRHILLGVAAYASAYKIKFEGFSPVQPFYLNMGYSGLLLGYIVAPVKIVHISIPVTLGAGMASISEKLTGEFENSNTYTNLENSLFLYVEPAFQVEINATRFMKFNLGFSYRFNHSLELDAPLTSSDLNNWTGNFSVVVGKF